MKFYKLHPEVAGHLGDKTVKDKSTHPPKVSRLHYVFDSLPSDGIITSLANFVVSSELRNDIEYSKLSGCDFAEVETSTSETFEELFPGRKLPQLFWMKVKGVAQRDDFGMSEDNRLVVSQGALDILKLNGLSACKITLI